MADDARTAALRLLATRELSEAQLRERLARRGHDGSAIDSAIARLKADRSLDDERVAAAIARSEATLRKRGRLRIRRRIEAAGIAPETARRAVDHLFEEIDADALLGAAIARRLRGRERLVDDREFERLYRYLLGQGFESDRIRAALRVRRAEALPAPPRTGADDDGDG
jgi:regulatory protein